MQALRKEDLFKSPGVAETLDWAAALTELDVVALDPATVSDTLGVLLKYQDDIARIEGTQGEGIARRGARGAAGGGVGSMSFRKPSGARLSGIHNQIGDDIAQLWLWIPGSRPAAVPGMTRRRRAVS